MAASIRPAHPALEKLRADLDALPLERLHPPSLPPDVPVDEARQLVALLRHHPELATPLSPLGITEELFQKTLLAADLAGDTQQRWQEVQRRRKKGSTWPELEARAQRMREELIAAARYHLRHDGHMLHELDLVQEGEGAADLILDLDTLARFVRARRRCFRNDPAFDPDERADAARAMAHELRDHMGEIPHDPERDALRKLRCRVFSLLELLLFEIRQAGLYRFWHDQPSLLAFTSTYEREHVRRGA